MQNARSAGFAALVLAVIALWADVAAAQVPRLVDHGGRVLSAPQVSPIYVGDYWATRPGAADALHTDAFLQTWLAGPSLSDVLAQYRVPRAAFASSDLVTGAAPAVFTEADAAALVQQERAAGRVFTDAQAVYVLYLPPGTVATFLGNSSDRKLGGYHSRYLDPATGLPVYFAVVVYSLGANGLDLTGDPQQNLSILSSRVLAGAFTNPDDGTAPAWFDTTHGEVGDVALSVSADATLRDVWTFQNGFAVALLWSNKLGRLDAGSATIGATATGEQTLALTPATQEALPGTTVTFTVTNAATSVDSLALTVSELLAGVTATLSATTLAPGASATLTVAVAADVATGQSVSVTVLGANALGISEVASATLSIVTALTAAAPAPAAADFTISVATASLDMPRGTVATFAVVTAPVGDAGVPLRVKVVGLNRRLKAYVSRTRTLAGDTIEVTIMAHRSARSRPYAFSVLVASKQSEQLVPVTVVLK
ncbi:MAG: hypothetical protein FJ027_11270 [Candidatus Rokubacteria bacterium]|nr:hypothetical protein [Candidatus Rokubacteria bacterium]